MAIEKTLPGKTKEEAKPTKAKGDAKPNAKPSVIDAIKAITPDQANAKQCLLDLIDRLGDVPSERINEAFTIAQEKARELGCIRLVTRNLKGFVSKRTGNRTKFGYRYEMNCGGYVADRSGVRELNQDGTWEFVTHTPVLIKEYRDNIVTDCGTVTLDFYDSKNGRWKSVTVDRGVIEHAREITSLSQYGLNATSNKASSLIRYFEALAYNNQIPCVRETPYLGFDAQGHFVPFDQDKGKSIPVWGGETSFSKLVESLTPKGSYETWKTEVKAIRASGVIAPRMALAASFASVLVSRIDILPFCVELYGATGFGKTLSMRLACSIWANPKEKAYIMGFDNTRVYYEATADTLNHLPFMIDDSSNKTSKINLEELVYMLTNGMGRGRSNVNLGQQREREWQLVVLATGERAISGQVVQGGAINRVIEVPCTHRLFADTERVYSTVMHNYGHAGRDFVRHIQDEKPDLKAMYAEVLRTLPKGEATDKQREAMAVVLLADKLATKWIFKDEKALTVEDVKDLLATEAEVSEGARAYAIIKQSLVQNRARYEPSEDNQNIWGDISGDDLRILPNALKRLLEDNGLSLSAFALWAKTNGKLVMGKDGKPQKVVKFMGKAIRAYVIKIEEDREEAEGLPHGFVPAVEEEDAVFS